jgi:hypothetical protein
VSKGRNGGTILSPPEDSVIEKLEPYCEMLFGALEVTKPKARHRLVQIRPRFSRGATLTKAKFERLVGKRKGR